MTESNLPQKQPSTVRDLIIANKEIIMKNLPTHIDLDRFINTSVMASKMTDALINCTKKSLLGCIAQTSVLGLELGTGTNEAYLVPFGKTCTLIIGYRGLMKLARQSGEIKSIFARIVYENEMNGKNFVIQYGLDPKLEHTPLPPSKRGKKVGVYAVAIYNDGGNSFEFLWEEEVDRAKSFSKTAGYSGSPWQLHTDDMWKKTAIRKLAKFLPSSVEKANRNLQTAVSIDELNETRRHQPNIIFPNEVLPDEVYTATFNDEDVIDEPKTEIKNVEDKPLVSKEINKKPEVVKEKNDDPPKRVRRTKAQIEEERIKELKENGLIEDIPIDVSQEPEEDPFMSDEVKIENTVQEDFIQSDEVLWMDSKSIPSRTFVCSGCGNIISNDSEEFDENFKLSRKDKNTVEVHCLNKECNKVSEARILS